MTRVRLQVNGTKITGFWAEVSSRRGDELLYSGDTVGLREAALLDGFLWAQNHGHRVQGYELVREGSHYAVRPKAG